jgi:hypothetical protein
MSQSRHALVPTNHGFFVINRKKDFEGLKKTWMKVLNERPG